MDIGRFGNVIIATMMISLILTVSNSFGQTGSVKFSAFLMDETNDKQSTMVSLYRINADGTDSYLLEGQDIVVGNEWFKVHLETNQRYNLELISNNGQQVVLEFDTNVPDDLSSKKHRFATKVNITGGALDITDKFLDSDEDALAYQSITNLGTVVYDQKAEAFIQRDVQPTQIDSDHEQLTALK